MVGTVSDTLGRPLSDVRMHVVEGSSEGVFSLTNPAGDYELPGPFTGAVVLRVEKPGYTHITRRLEPAIPGQIRADIFLPQLDTANLTGDWTVTLTASESCKDIPETIRARQYAAPIALAQDPSTSFDAQLRSDSLFSHWTNNILVHAAGTDAKFAIPAWDWGIGIAEDLGDSKQVFIWGEGLGAVGPSTMAGVLTGGFEYTDYSVQAPVTIKCETFQLTGVRR